MEITCPDTFGVTSTTRETITKLPDGLFPADADLEARLRRKMGGGA